MTQGKRLRLGLLGTGRRGRAHLSAIAGLGDLYDFIAVCDLSEANARAAAERSGTKAYSDIREFFSQERLDVVDIVTPAESHHLMAKMAADHSVHMLIETPLAPTRAMMDFIIEAADKAGIQVEVGENYCRRPLERLNRKALDANLIGKVLRISSFYGTGGHEGMFYHAMSLFRHYAGSEVAEVRSFARQFRVERSDVAGAPIDTEDWIQPLLSFSNGVLGSCTQVSSWISPLRRGHPRFITVEGTNGLLSAGRGGVNALYRLEKNGQATYALKTEIQSRGGQEIPVRFYYETDPLMEYVNPYVDRPLNYADSWGATDIIAIADELTSIHRAVVNESPPEYGMMNARKDQELSIAINESARIDGKPVHLPLTGETPWEHEQHQAFRLKWGGDPLKDTSRLLTSNFSRRPA